MNPADRPVTEPRTEAGKALAAKAKRESWSNWEGLAQFTIPDIEAEAAQGAAPLDRMVLAEAIQHAGLPMHYLHKIMDRYASQSEGAAPLDRHRPDDPGCPCWNCHLEAEAEDATWD